MSFLRRKSILIQHSPVISSGKIESRTSRSSVWSSRPIIFAPPADRRGTWLERVDRLGGKEDAQMGGN